MVECGLEIVQCDQMKKSVIENLNVLIDWFESPCMALCLEWTSTHLPKMNFNSSRLNDESSYDDEKRTNKELRLNHNLNWNVFLQSKQSAQQKKI